MYVRELPRFAVDHHPIGHATGTLELRITSLSPGELRTEVRQLALGSWSVAAGDHWLLMTVRGTTGARLGWPVATAAGPIAAVLPGVRRLAGPRSRSTSTRSPAAR
jgi:hypothetical protein